MPSPLFAFGFVNLAMLGWLAAVAAPILIHLWSRRKYREMSWAAMEYLLAAAKRQTRRVLFERWLLLLVRASLITFVVLAMAEPYFVRPGVAVSPVGHTHHVLVLDASYSMGYRPTDKTRCERAKELARQIVRDSPQGDAFTLVLMSSPPQTIVAEPTLERSEIRREIDNLRLPHMTADLPATIAAVGHLIETVERDSPRLAQHEVCFLTDLQRATWAPKLSSTAAAAFLKQTEDLSRIATLRLIDVGQPAAENLAVTSLRPAEPLMIVGRPVQLQAEVKNFGTQVRARQPIELLVDGRRIEQKEINVPPQTAASVAFSYRFDSAGDHAIEVRTSGDALDIDNHCFLAVRLRNSIRTLCIDGRPSGQPFHGEADYLAVALTSPEGSTDRGLIETEVAAENAITQRDLRTYDCLLLCNVAQFTANEARALDAYLRGGGNVVFFLGDQVLPDRYNIELGGAGQGRGARPRILPAKLGAVVETPQSSLDPLDYQHPILQPFRGRGETALLQTPIFKYYKLMLPENSPAKTVLATSDRNPLMVEEPIGRGRVVLVATSAEPQSSWTAMPLWPSFVPLVQETVAWCVGGRLQGSNLLAGEPFDASGGLQAVSASLSVQTPDGRTRSVPSQTADDRSLPQYRDTTQSGIYIARLVGGDFSRRSASANGYSETFAVNVDTAESDLAQMTPEELQADVWPGIPLVHQTSWQEPGDVAATKASQTGSRFHVSLLYATLGLLLAESFLAWRMGRK